ncbi:GNAT family N-acetyltransferase [Celerinatantimonas diazotrophica]|uniref:GNAT family N-acetyltransferase n=1 Tax=Celerinatantimonas diazotrophica TaxID=412034 RepID=A0A4R1J8N4_9GAMM|nr:GNAT family N-acetyltransferase [Celerinatantimonas diazotrophica]TCK46955.1 hypothetical protein EV690_3107 [Celerinatantimonas diazotrophica]CAG9295723.1 hypothetical protein CEDIAZO_00849 [Celerinatantimonas diazotrophica]
MSEVKSGWIQNLDDCPKQQWQALVKECGPFVQYDFLNIFEQSGCVGANTGWQVCHWLMWDNEQLVAAVPGYIKYHSFGEYVFDWGWADSYQRAGVAYYPKWISSVPFTPITDERLLMAANVDAERVWQRLEHDLLQLRDKYHFSGMHWLFTPAHWQASESLMKRCQIQYHWHNQNYHNFDDFLSRLTSRKRKMIRKERRAVADYGIEVERLSGETMSERHWQCLVKCYQQTYLEHSGHSGYLNEQWFALVRKQLSQQIMVVFASYEEQLIAASLFFKDKDTLYGRYWGSLAHAELLHFELCYYQGIDYCIEQQLRHFNAGAQGEHKLLRGFEPTYCYSYHRLEHPEFSNALAELLNQERAYMTEQYQQALNILPFKHVIDDLRS